MTSFFHRLLDVATRPLRAVLSAPSRLLSGWQRVAGISLPARVAILVAFFLVVCVAVTLIAFYYTQDRSFVRAKLTLTFFSVIVVLLVLIPLVVYKALKLWLEGDVSPFPDIDRAWQAGLAELQRHGLYFSEIPLFLILGSAGEEHESSLFDASRLSLNVRQVPRGPAPLHWYANAEGIYLACGDACCLSRLAELAAEVIAEEAPRPAAGSPRSPADRIRGTIVAGDEDAGGASATTSGPLPSPSAPRPGGPAEIRGTMVVGSQTSFDSTDAAPAEKRIVKLPQDEVALQSRRLQYVCRLIRRARDPLCPLNGILTLLPFGLIQRSVPESIEVQRAVQKDLSTLLHGLMVRCPVTAVVVGLEEESGFRELVQRVGRERAWGQRFGKGFSVWTPPLPDRMRALAAHACGSFEDWVYTLFRERGALSKPGNTKLYALLCKIRRSVHGRLADILAAAYGAQGDPEEPAEAFFVGGCYFAATGPGEDRQAFVKGVFDKLPEQQEELQWTAAAYEKDQRYQTLSQLGLAVDALLLLALAAVIVNQWVYPLW